MTEPSEDALDRILRGVANDVSRRLGDLALEKGWITRNELQGCLRDQEEDPDRPLGEILVKKGYVRGSQVDALLHEQQGRDLSSFLAARAASAPSEVFEAQNDPERSFGRYVLVEEIGVGGMGRIWRSWDLELNRWVALKLLRDDASANVRRRFIREAQTAGRLQHPHLVTIHDAGEINGRAYLVMELIKGETLDLSRPKEEVLVQLLKVARALAFAHDNAIIHRDLKPGNILIDRNGEPHVVDFGLAHLLDSRDQLTQTGATIGTPAYMAPEQVRGHARFIGPWTDVYALGTILYELMMGIIPHKGDTAAVVFTKILNEDPPPPVGDPDLVTICLKAMEKDHMRRYPVLGDFADDLQRFLDGELIAGKRPSPGYRMKKWFGKRRAVLAAVMGTLVMVAVITLALSSLLRTQKFDRLQDEAVAAFGDKNWPGALAKCEEALKLRDEESLRELAEKCRSNIERDERRLRLEEELKPVREKILETIPSFYIPNINIGRRIAELEKALRKLEDVAAKEKDTGLADLWSVLGRGWYWAGDHNLAEKRLRKAAQMNPKDGRANYLLGRIYLERALMALFLYSSATESEQRDRTRRWNDRALEYLNKPLDAWAGTEEIERHLAGVYRAMAEGDHARLRRLCEEGLNRFGEAPGTEAYNLFLGSVTADPERIRHFNEAIGRRPHYAWAYLMRGDAFREAGRINDALFDYDDAIRVNPRFAVAWINRGNLRYAKKLYRKAIRDFDEAIRLMPGSAHAHSNRGLAKMELGEHDDALKDFDRAVELDPEFAPLYNNRGALKMRMRNTRGALKDFRKAIEFRPTLASAHLNCAAALDLLGETDEALKCLKQAERLNPTLHNIFFLRAEIYRKKRQWRAAVAEYSKVIRQKPDHHRPYTARARIRFRLRDYKGAESDFGQVIRLLPEDAAAWFNRSVARVKLKNVAGVLSDCDKALSINPRFPDALQYRGWALNRQGKFREAAIAYEAALQHAPANWRDRDAVKKWLAAVRKKIEGD